MPKLELKFLGFFSVAHDGAPVTGFESNKVRALLAYLAVEAQRPHSREVLAGLLWPDWPDSAARSNLRYALADLRKVIGDQMADPPFLHISREAIQFNIGSDHCLDVAEFVGLGNHSGGMPSSEEHLERLCQVLALYQGEFLEGLSVPEAAPFEEWVRLKREQLHRQHLDVLGELAAAYERGGDVKQALVYAWQQVEIEPWQESGQRQLMRLLALSGQRSAALAQYEACRRILREELHAEPSLETTALYESIRDGRLDFQAGTPAILEELPPAPGVPPFMGLQYFDERDADLYFGREALTARLVGQLRELQGDRFLAVVGASGSGKSSLVRAGLVPAIRRGEKLADGSTPPRWSHRWLVHVITPTAHPLEALATSLTREGGSVSSTAALIDDLGRDPRSLHLYARRMTHLRNAPRLLLVVDQFEELFTLCRSESERQAFIDNLLVAAGVETPDTEAETKSMLPDRLGQDGQDKDSPLVANQAGGDGPVVAVIALRADFYNHCAQYAGLRSALGSHQEFIGPMSPAELRRAIEEPARQNDWEFEPGLVDLILREVSDEPGGLPLLSHALLETWERRRGRTLTLKGYAEAGGIQEAIAQTAESVYTGLTPEKRDLARRIFLRLTELGEGTQDTRRRASVDELVPSAEAATQIEAVLNTLVEARLVTAGEGTVEVAHEALIREWPALRQWLDEDREGLRLHHHITEAAQAWEAMGRDPGELYRGARLVQAIEWARQPGNADALNAQEREFLTASKEAEEREVAEREAQRQRELEAAQRAAEAERRHAEAERQRAEEQTHSASRLRRRAAYLVGVVLIALIMAGVAAAFASRNSTLAVQNAESARYANTQQAIAEAEADGRATQQAIAEGESLARATQQALAENEAQARATAETTALQERDLAQARELAAASVNNLLSKGDPELSALLSLHSMQLAYSPDVETALRQALLAMRRVRLLTGDKSDVINIDYNSDGTRLVTTSTDGTAKIWDANNGQELLTLPEKELVSAIFSPDGSQVAAYVNGGTARVWDAATGQELLRVSANTYWTSMLDFSPDGKLLATPTDEGITQIWEVSSGKLLASLKGHTDSAWGARFSPDGRRLVTTSEDSTAIIWDTAAWQPVRTITSEANAFSDQAFSPDGSRLAFSTGSEIRVLDASSGSDLLSIPNAGLSIAYSPDGSRLATGKGEGVTIFDSSTGEVLLSLSGKIASAAFSVAFSPDGKHLASSGEGGSTIIWDISPEGSREVLAVANPDGMSGRIAVSPDGSRFVTTNYDGSVQVWDSSTGHQIQKIQAHDGAAWDADFSPDGTRLVTAGADDLVKVWDLTSGQELLTLEGHIDIPTYTVGGFYNGVLEATFSPDGSLIASAGEDGMVRIWDASTSEQLQSLQVDPDKAGVTNVTFSPDGTLLAATSEGIGDSNAAVALWRITRTTAVEYFRRTDFPVYRCWGLAISPADQGSGSGQSLAVGCSDAVLRILSADQKGQVLAELTDQTAIVTSAHYSADGSVLATSSRDGTVKIRDGKSGEPIKTILPGHDLRFIALSPDGRFMFTAGGDVVAREFMVKTEDLIALARSRLTRGLTSEECQKYLHVDTCPAGGN